MWLFLYSMLMFWIFLGVMMELVVCGLGEFGCDGDGG